MEELYEYRRKLLERLEGVVSDLTAAWQALPSPIRHLPLEEGGESPHRVLAHLRAMEAEALSVRLWRILNEEEPQVPLFDDTGWMEAHYRADESAESILEDYARLRRTELSWLKDLPPQAWNRTCRHPWFGVRTLQWWTEQCLVYAEEHLRRLRAGIRPVE